MPKRKHAEFERIRIDEQLYLLKYADGRVKVVLQEGTLEVTEVMTRSGESTPGSHVFLRLRRDTHPKPTLTRAQRTAARRLGVHSDERKAEVRGFATVAEMKAFEERPDFPGWDAL